MRGPLPELPLAAALGRITPAAARTVCIYAHFVGSQ